MSTSNAATDATPTTTTKRVYKFTERYVPNRTVTDQFEGKFCRCGSGKTGIVTGYKLVLDTRPGREKYLRWLYYGVNYITGRDWQSFDPKPLSLAELQKVTWAWGGAGTARKALFDESLKLLEDKASPGQRRALKTVGRMVAAVRQAEAMKALGLHAQRRGTKAAKNLELVTLDAE